MIILAKLLMMFALGRYVSAHIPFEMLIMSSLDIHKVG